MTEPSNDLPPEPNSGSGKDHAEGGIPPPLQKASGQAPAAGPVQPSTDDDLLVRAPLDPTRGLLGRSGIFLCFLAVIIGVLGEAASWCLFKLIGLFTNICFYQRFSFAFSAPTTAHVGWWVLLIPVGGGLIVGLMARYGSEMIRGHGIPEAMASALFHESKIPPRVAILKPLSAAVSIGTGCPFGAEGPIIATGAALGSIVGQVITVTKERRRVLLAAGAAAGMSATFGAPLASVLMALELLLFEFQPIAILAVAIAAGVAGALRIAIMGGKPIFAMPALPRPTLEPLMIYAIIGIVCGVAAVGLTHGVYLVEDIFSKRSKLHWMWWPALGGLIVGICGLIFNPSMGVGYVNISAILDGKVGFEFVLFLVLTRMVSWTVALGSGTSGSTMAPLFNIGSALGAVIGISIVHLIPHADVNVRAAALVGMAALFCGATWTPLTSIVFAFETTLRPNGLAPIVAGCTTSFLVSCALMRDNILTEKFARRGGRALFKPHADFMDSVMVIDACTRNPVCIRADETAQELRVKLSTDEKYIPYDGFPVVDDKNHLVGVLANHDLLSPDIDPQTKARDLIRRPPVVIYGDCALRRADQMMNRHRVGRLIVMDREHPSEILGIITRDDLLTAHRQRS